MFFFLSLEFNETNQKVYNAFDKRIVEKLIKVNDDDMDIVMGRWDFTVQMAIDEVKQELCNGKDKIDEKIEEEIRLKESLSKVCENGHITEQPRGNQRYCKVCKCELIQTLTEYNRYDSVFPHVVDIENVQSYKKMKLLDGGNVPYQVIIEDLTDDDKAHLYPRV